MIAKLKKALMGTKKTDTHAVAVHLGSQKYFILGTTRRPRNCPEPLSWFWRERGIILAKLAEQVPTMRRPQLVMFVFENKKQKEKFIAAHGTVIAATYQGNPNPRPGRVSGVIPNFTQHQQEDLPKNLEANQLWLVEYEGRPNVIAISPLGDGFFAPGQEPCWGFPCVEDWTQLVHPGFVESDKRNKNLTHGS
jgi:hypothetical protein